MNYVADYGDYRFAITEFIPGITLRELLLSNELHSVGAIMFDVGIALNHIAAHVFPDGGFFDQNLNIIKKANYEDYLIFAKECLKNQMVLIHLDVNMISKINLLLDCFVDFLPPDNEKNLVHADFDPSNILVNKVDSVWKITGILDWEFAFSGSVLFDVANMLRYAHKMPPVFKEEFLRGLKIGGITLPDNWGITCDLLNLVALLDCLVRSDLKNSINRCKDICTLIEHIVDKLEKHSTYKPGSL